MAYLRNRSLFRHIRFVIDNVSILLPWRFSLLSGAAMNSITNVSDGTMGNENFKAILFYRYVECDRFQQSCDGLLVIAFPAIWI